MAQHPQGDSMTEKQFEPQLTAFYCVYCGYMAAGTAGILQLQYPANVKFVRMPCTGKTDIRYILEAFEQGADGVYLVACPIGNCHHVRGNERGQARVERAKTILDDVGLGSGRLDMFFMSGSEGQTFAHAAKIMTERVRELGPSPLKIKNNANDYAAAKEEADDSSFRGRREKQKT